MRINSNFKKVAVRAVKEAGEIIKRYYKKQIKSSFKRDFSLVTNVDILVENKIVRLIKENFPSHDILSEEKGGEIGKDYTWIIDPLDGTANYIRNIPFFSTSTALLYKRNPILGVVFDPINEELYYAEQGKGAFLNNKEIKIGQQRILSKAVILFSRKAGENSIKFYRIISLLGRECLTFRVLGSITLSLCYLASGKVDAIFAIGHSPWDLAAGTLIIKEAGGEVTNFKGEDWQIDTKNIITANSLLHSRLLKLIRSRE